MTHIYMFPIPSEMLLELAKREKQHGIFPEKDVDVYMKVSTCIYSAGCWILCILVIALMN
jgi:hypothetical protein